MINKTVLILGASKNPERYTYLAQELLIQMGYQVIPINPKEAEILNTKVLPSLDAVSDAVDTVTIYVNPKILEKQKEALAKLKPRRIIFNPGTEDLELEKYFQDFGITCLRACTLVLLRTNQFE